METAPGYNSPITGLDDNEADYSLWNLSLKMFDEQQYRKSFIIFLRFLDPTSDISEDDQSINSVILKHGSIQVQFHFTEDTYLIRAPFVNIPDERNIPILRQVAELNFSTLGVSQIELKQNHLCFTYQSLMQLCNPHKLYEIMQEICLTADKHDDVFVEKFNAKYIVQPDIIHYEAQEKELCWQAFQSSIVEAQQLSSELEQSHENDASYYSIAANLMKISNYINPQGYLKYQLDEIINQIHNNDSVDESIRKSRENLKRLLKISRTEFDESLYHIKSLVNSRRRIGLPDVQSLMRGMHDYGKQQRSENKFKIASIIFLYNIHKILYYRKSPKFVEGTLLKGLALAAGKDWAEACNELWRASTRVMDMDET